MEKDKQELKRTITIKVESDDGEYRELSLRTTVKTSRSKDQYIKDARRRISKAMFGFFK